MELSYELIRRNGDLRPCTDQPCGPVFSILASHSVRLLTYPDHTPGVLPQLSENHIFQKNRQEKEAHEGEGCEMTLSCSEKEIHSEI